MFLGQYKHSIDAKSRLSIPRKFLEPFRDPSRGRLFYATRGLEKCIFLFLRPEWEDIVEQVRQGPLGSAEARGFARQFFALARELSIDGSGRILLPREYLEIAGIDSEVVLVGVDRRIELWSPGTWEEENSRSGQSYEEHAKEIFRA